MDKISTDLAIETIGREKILKEIYRCIDMKEPLMIRSLPGYGRTHIMSNCIIPYLESQNISFYPFYRFVDTIYEIKAYHDFVQGFEHETYAGGHKTTSELIRNSIAFTFKKTKGGKIPFYILVDDIDRVKSTGLEFLQYISPYVVMIVFRKYEDAPPASIMHYQAFFNQFHKIDMPALTLAASKELIKVASAKIGLRVDKKISQYIYAKLTTSYALAPKPIIETLVKLRNRQLSGEVIDVHAIRELVLHEGGIEKISFFVYVNIYIIGFIFFWMIWGRISGRRDLYYFWRGLGMVAFAITGALLWFSRRKGG